MEGDNVVCNEPAERHGVGLDNEAAAAVGGETESGKCFETWCADAAQRDVAACFGHTVGGESGNPGVEQPFFVVGRNGCAADNDVMEPEAGRLLEQSGNLGRHDSKQVDFRTLGYRRSRMARWRFDDYPGPRFGGSDEHHFPCNIVGRQWQAERGFIRYSEKAVGGKRRCLHIRLEEPDFLRDTGGAGGVRNDIGCRCVPLTEKVAGIRCQNVFHGRSGITHCETGSLKRRSPRIWSGEGILLTYRAPVPSP